MCSGNLIWQQFGNNIGHATAMRLQRPAGPENEEKAMF
jgi:hypothetical protein